MLFSLDVDIDDAFAGCIIPKKDIKREVKNIRKEYLKERGILRSKGTSYKKILHAFKYYESKCNIYQVSVLEMWNQFKQYYEEQGADFLEIYM